MFLPLPLPQTWGGQWGALLPLLSLPTINLPLTCRSPKTFKVLGDPKWFTKTFIWLLSQKYCWVGLFYKSLSLFCKKKIKACQHSQMIPVTLSSPFSPLQRLTGTSLSSCWLHPPSRHLILFLRHPPVPGQLALPTLLGLKRLRKKRMVWVLIIEKLWDFKV